MALTDNLVSYWKMDEASGNRADAHGANTLTDNNTVGAATGIINNAADFELSSSESLSILDVTQSGLDLAGDMTISMWIKPESMTGSHGLVTKFRDLAGNKSYRLHCTTTDIALTLTSNGTTETSAIWTFTLSAGTWYHLVLVYTASAGSATLYVNNTSQGAKTGLSTSVFNSVSVFRLGSRSSALDVAEQFFDGLMDEVGIWSRTLSSTEVATLYGGGAGLAYPLSTTNIKTINGLAVGSVKTFDGLAIASVKTINGLS